MPFEGIGAGKSRPGIRRIPIAADDAAQFLDRGHRHWPGVPVRHQRGSQQRADHWLARRELDRLPQGRNSLAGPPALKQGLTLELPEIRIARLRLDQRIDLRHRTRQIATAIGRDGAGIATASEVSRAG